MSVESSEGPAVGPFGLRSPAVSRTRRSLSEDERARLAAIRADVAERVSHLRWEAPASQDILGAIAWVSGLHPLAHPYVAGLIDEALFVHRREWSEVAAAVGVNPDDRVEVENLARYHRRHRKSR